MKHRSTAVSSKAIELALRGESFTVQDLQRGLNDPPSRQTIYRVLEQLRTDDWIEQRGKRWHPGVKTDLLGDPADDPVSVDLDIDRKDRLSGTNIR